MMNTQTRFSGRIARLCVLAATVVAIGQVQAGMLVESVSEHYDTFRGVDYVRYTGRFEGTTSKGTFRVPFEIVAPADPGKGNRTVVFEPPHFIYGTFARDVVLGSDLLFNRRFSHASVGFSNEGFNLLNPFAADAVIAGIPVLANMPAEGAIPFPRDVEILKQFAEALVTDPTAVAALGQIDRRYAYGLSQSAEAMYELFYGPGAAGIFDLTVLHVPLWRPPFARPDVLATLPDTFTPLSDIGKVMIVSAEGDLLISQSMQLRNAAAHPDYRLYEVAGAPHLALDVVVDGVRTNPLDLTPIVRAAFNNGHRWQMGNKLPPASTLLDAAAPGEIDPVYWASTGIARDANLNAAGGVRFPDVSIGRAFHFPSAPGVEVIPGLPGLIGFWFDLACAPAPHAISPEPRFANHGDYVRQVIRTAFTLARQGYILRSDMRELIRAAAKSDVGKPGTCSAAP
jgi:hypothetical protein